MSICESSQMGASESTNRERSTSELCIFETSGLSYGQIFREKRRLCSATVKMGYALASESARFGPRDALPPPQLYHQQTLTACLVPLCLTARHRPPLPLCRRHSDRPPSLADATSARHLDTCHPASRVAFDISPTALFGSMSYHRRYTLLCIE